MDPCLLRTFVKYQDPVSTPTLKLLLSGFKSVEWTEVTTQGLPPPPMSSCSSSAFEDEEDVLARVDSKSAFFFFFSSLRLGLCVVVSRSPGSSVGGAPAASLRPQCAASHWLCDFYSSPGHFFGGKRGDKQANAPSIETPHLLCFQLNTRLYRNLCRKEARAFGTAAGTQAGVNLLIECDLMHCELDVTWELFVKILNYIKYI